MTQLLSILVGLATVLLVAALALPHFHAATYDAAGKLSSHSGLWTQVLRLSSQPRNPRKYCSSVNRGICGSNLDKHKKHVNDPDCAMSHGACKPIDDLCGEVKATDEASCEKSYGTRCGWSKTLNRCAHSGKLHGTLVADASMPWGQKVASDAPDASTRAAMAWTRALGILAASLGGVTFAIATGSERPHALLCALTSLAAAGSGLAVLILYATALSDSFGLEGALKSAIDNCPSIPSGRVLGGRVPFIPGVPNPFPGVNPGPVVPEKCKHPILIEVINHVLHGAYANGDALTTTDVSKYGASYWMAASAVGLLALAGGVGIGEARRA